MNQLTKHPFTVYVYIQITFYIFTNMIYRSFTRFESNDNIIRHTGSRFRLQNSKPFFIYINVIKSYDNQFNNIND